MDKSTFKNQPPQSTHSAPASSMEKSTSLSLLAVSDLHLEFEPFELAAIMKKQGISAPDVLVLAGDIGVGVKGMEWAARQREVLKCEVLYVKGNHELYGRQFDEVVDLLRITGNREGIFYLDCDEIILKGVRFLGATLWTDFEINGITEKVWAIRDAKRYMNDFFVIKKEVGSSFMPEDSIEIHRQERAWLEGKLSRPFDGKTCVVTHHLPLPNSVAERYQGDSLSPAFASDLTALFMRTPPDLWIHGHTHDSFDYLAGDARVYCNPKGYRNENRAFSIDKKIIL